MSMNAQQTSHQLSATPANNQSLQDEGALFARPVRGFRRGMPAFAIILRLPPTHAVILRRPQPTKNLVV